LSRDGLYICLCWMFSLPVNKIIKPASTLLIFKSPTGPFTSFYINMWTQRNYPVLDIGVCKSLSVLWISFSNISDFFRQNQKFGIFPIIDSGESFVHWGELPQLKKENFCFDAVSHDDKPDTIFRCRNLWCPTVKSNSTPWLMAPKRKI